MEICCEPYLGRPLWKGPAHCRYSINASVFSCSVPSTRRQKTKSLASWGGGRDGRPAEGHLTSPERGGVVELGEEAEPLERV